jgi:hypothetical protein
MGQMFRRGDTLRFALPLLLRYLCLFANSGVQRILCLCIVFLRFVYPMLPVSLDCPYFIPFRYSLTFI